MAFDETRLGGDGLEKIKNGIESFDMADLQDAIFLLRELNELGGLDGIIGHRFFDENMFALREHGFCDFKMRRGGRDDVQRVAGGGGFGDGIKNARLIFLRNFAGGFGVRIKNSGELDKPGVVKFGIDAGMMLTERTGAEDGDFDFCHA